MKSKLLKRRAKKYKNMNFDDITTIHGDCLKIIPEKIADESIDMILTDLPYGITQNKWDIPIPFNLLWPQYERIIKPNGAMVFTATQPFASQLVVSNPKLFRYDIIWEKTINSGQMNVNNQPLRSHELILVFYKKLPTYNEQKTEGTPYEIHRTGKYKPGSYNPQQPSIKINNGFRHARSVIKIPNPRIKGGHPTQKPVKLLEYLIKTYTNEGDLVLDNCMGMGSTGIACLNLKRRFIGIEFNDEYFKKSEKILTRNKMNGKFNNEKYEQTTKPISPDEQTTKPISPDKTTVDVDSTTCGIEQEKE